MTETAHLYRLTSPSGRAYIGITKNPKKRWGEHVQSSRSGSNCALHKAIRKYGWGAFKCEVLVVSTVDYIKDLERKAIQAFSTLAPGGYNLTSGGDGTFGYKFDEETKLRIAESNRGQKRSDTTRLKLSESNRGKTLSEETKRKIGEASRQHERTPEWCESIRASLSGKPHSEAVKALWADPEYRARMLAARGYV